MKLADHIKELKRLIKTEHEISVANDYFLDHISPYPSLHQKGKPTKKKEFYKQLLAPVLKSQGTNVELSDLLVVEIKKYRFAHGAIFLTNGKMGTIIFFDDIITGIVDIATPGVNHDYYRLTAIPLQGTTSPIIPVSTSDKIH